MTTVRVTASHGGSQLETRMRRALAWYPRAWREQHGAEMLGVLLDVAEATGAERPSLGQRLDLARNGLAQRLVGGIPPALLDRAAASAMLGATAFALFHFVFFEWEPWAPWSADQRHVFWAPFSTLSAYLDLAWLLGAALMLFGWHRGGKAVIAATGLAAVALFAVHYGLRGEWPSATTILYPIIAAPFVCAGRLRRGAHSGLTLLAVLGTAAAMLLAYRLFAFDYRVFTWFRRSDNQLWFLPDANRKGSLVPLAIALALVVGTAIARRRRLARAIGAALLPWALLWCMHLIHDSHTLPFGGDDYIFTTRTHWILSAVFAAACLVAFTLWRFQLARAARSKHPPEPVPDDQEPLYG